MKGISLSNKKGTDKAESYGSDYTSIIDIWLQHYSYCSVFNVSLASMMTYVKNEGSVKIGKKAKHSKETYQVHLDVITCLYRYSCELLKSQYKNQKNKPALVHEITTQNSVSNDETIQQILRPVQESPSQYSASELESSYENYQINDESENLAEKQKTLHENIRKNIKNDFIDSEISISTESLDNHTNQNSDNKNRETNDLFTWSPDLIE